VQADAVGPRRNLAHDATTGVLDASHLASLTDDAVPALVEAVPALEAPGRDTTAIRELLSQRTREVPVGRAFHLGRWRAARTAAANPVSGGAR
jgi:hypothetical protein